MTTVAERVCATCGTPDTFPDDPKSETAPYGPGGGLICARCAFGTPEQEAATKARWQAVTEAESAMGVAHIVDPR